MYNIYNYNYIKIYTCVRHACPIYHFYLIIVVILVYVKITNYEYLRIISRDCASTLFILPFSYIHYKSVYVCVTYFPIEKSINVDLP